ncbi:MAG: DUF2341 domain-containing protein, partial [Methanomicrobiales archaeon]
TYLTLNDGDLGNNASFTISSWFYVDTPTAWTGIVTRGREQGVDWVGLWANSNQYLLGWDWSGTPSKGGNLNGDILAAHTWYYGVGTFDGTNRFLSLNGSLSAGPSAGYYNQMNTTYTSIGNDRASGSSNSFDGIIDEVRVSNVNRSSGWIQTEYNSQNRPDLFIQKGAEESGCAGSPLILSPCDWSYRKKITITTGAAGVSSGYTASVTVNHAALVTAAKSRADGNDLRVAYWNATTGWTELSRAVDPLSSWNSASTKLWFPLAAAIPASSSDTNYYLYYGNATAGSPPADWASIFRIGDEFNDGTLTSTLATSTAGNSTITETGGDLYIDMGTTETDAGIVVTANQLPTDKKFMIRHKTKFLSIGGDVSNNPEMKALGIYQLATRPGVTTSALENARRRITMFQRYDQQNWITYTNSTDFFHSWNGTPLAWKPSIWAMWGNLPMNTYDIYELISDGTSWYTRITDANGNVLATTTSVTWANTKNDGNPYWFYWGDPYSDPPSGYYYGDQKSDWVYMRDYVSPEPTASLGTEEPGCGSGTPLVFSPCSWTSRKLLTTNITMINGTQSNFPALVSLSSDADLAADAQDNGNDIVFTDSTGTQIPHEIESFSGTTGALVAWVKLPTVSSSVNTDIYMYYGNSSTASQQNASGVWDSNYRGVWHMNVTADSTSLNTCTNQGSTSTTGKVNNARYFGTSQYIDCGAFENLNNQLTLETWLKLDTNIPASTWPNDVGKGNENWGGWRLYSQNSNQLMFAYNGSDNSIHYDLYDNINLGTWYQVAITFDVSGNSARMYVNGQPYMTAGASHGISNGPQNLIIGTTSNQLNTNLDEVRISNVARSPGWIATEYANQNRPDLFFSVGTEEASPCGGSGGSGCTGIAVDSTASGASGNSTSTLSISHTTSGSNRLMLVGVSLQDSDTSWNDYTNKVNVSSISYNGKSLSRVGYALNADDARVEIWRLIAPDTGTYNVIITLNQSLHNNGYIVGGVMTFTGVDQTTPLGTFASQALNESVIPVNVTVSSAANELVFGAIANEYGSISSDTTGGQIGRWSRHVGIGMDAGDGNGLEYTNGAGSTKPGAASVKMNWTLGNWYNHWAAAGVSIKPCSSGCTLGTVGVDVISSGQNTTPISGITLSHATSGSNRLMLVGVTINNDNFEGVSTIAYNG